MYWKFMGTGENNDKKKRNLPHPLPLQLKFS